MRWFKVAVIILVILLLPFGCQVKTEKRSVQIYDVFDTVVTITAYTDSEESFNALVNGISGELRRMHALFDVYGEATASGGLSEINRNAGVRSVKAEKDVIELLGFASDMCMSSRPAFDISKGAVYSLWRNARISAGSGQPVAPPEASALAEADAKGTLEDIIIDIEASEVYLRNEGMMIDAGAVAKGYAVERAAEAAERAGYSSFLIDAGGNVRVSGYPADRATWVIGVRDPFAEGRGEIIELIELESGAVATSGGYERFFEYEGVEYSHIIDPSTKMPARGFASVSVQAGDAGTADALSTALFVLTYEEGKLLAEKYGASAIWITDAGELLR